jgi:hypothetical protein
MTADAVLSRELKSLQDEMSGSNRERSSPPPDRKVTPAGQPEDAPQGPPPNRQIREFVKASVIGAMVVAILIGRLLGRR